MPTTRTPARVQRTRKKGQPGIPAGAVYVGRGTKWGNPFTIEDAIEAEWSNPRSACATNYREWLRVGTEGGWYEETYRLGRQVLDRRHILADLHELRGLDLACWCPLPAEGEPDHCHAAVLLELANTPAA